MQEFLDIAHRQVGIAIDEEQQALAREIKGIKAQASALGYLRSGRLLVELDRACGHAITKRGSIVWELLHRCITIGRIGFSEDLAEELKDFALPYLTDTVDGLTQYAALEAAKMGMPELRLRLQDSEVARKNAQRRLDTEIDLFCGALSKASQDPAIQPQPVINIHGSNVGSVQTGSHSAATATLHCSNIYQERAREALDALRQELLAANQQGAPLFLVSEGKAELAKSEPNKTRLHSIVDSIKACVAGTIETATKIPSAIEGVQKAISLLSM